jgi:two-component system LytT family response regulator
MSPAIERRPLRVLVVDDEPLGVKRLLRLLSAEPRVDVVGTAKNGDEAVESIRSLEPDLVFLDIQMPRKTGLEVVQEIGSARMPVTIFVTAYDQYALRAFDLAAVDYLVKPYDDERFEQAFRRARRMIDLEGRNRVMDHLLAVLHSGVLPGASPAPTASPSPKYLERIAAQKRGKLAIVQVDDLEYVTASGPYCELHSGGQRHLVREAIQSLEEKLDPGRFLRIHRSAIIRMDLVEALLRTTSGDLEVLLKGGATLRVGRSRRDEVQRRLGRL